MQSCGMSAIKPQSSQFAVYPCRLASRHLRSRPSASSITPSRRARPGDFEFVCNQQSSLAQYLQQWQMDQDVIGCSVECLQGSLTPLVLALPTCLDCPDKSTPIVKVASVAKVPAQELLGWGLMDTVTTHRADSATAVNSAERGTTRSTLCGSPQRMTTNEPQAVESTASRPNCIAHAVCHDCAKFEELHEADTVSSAKADAIAAAIKHARETDCENVEHKVVDSSISSETTEVSD